MATTAIIGGTGLVGSHIVNTLLALPSVSHIDFLARRALTDKRAQTLIETHPNKLSPFISTEPPSKWASHIRSATPVPEVFFSSMATTRAVAGGLAAQRALELDANLDLARAAKEMGTKVYVLISSVGADKSSSFPYLKMKGEVEQSILDLKFDKTIIIRPGIIAGDREVKRLAEVVMGKFGGLVGCVSKPWLRDWWMQDASEVAKAAVNASMRALKGSEGEGQEKVRILGGKDIVRLGRTEWEEPSSTI